MMKASAATMCFMLALGLLLWEYPWSTIHGRFGYGRSESIVAYAATALVMTGVALLIQGVVGRLMSDSARTVLKTVATWMATLTALGVVGLVFGPLGINIPGTRVRGIFFAEWQFVAFFLVTIPYALVSAVVLTLAGRHQHDPRL